MSNFCFNVPNACLTLSHELAGVNDEENLKKIEEEIDKLSAQIWGLTKEELKEIKLSLEKIG